MIPHGDDFVTYDIRLYGDDGWSVELLFVTDATTQTPIDLTGRTYRAQVRASAGSPAVLAELDIDTADAATGRVRVSIPPELVRGLSGEWDLEETIPGQSPQTLFRGKVTWRQDVTR